MSEQNKVLLHALLMAASDPRASREALEELAALGDDPDRLAELTGSAPAERTIGKRRRSFVTKSHKSKAAGADDEDGGAPGADLARWYARWFDALEESGLEPTPDDIAEAEAELDGSGWSVGRDDSGDWRARPTATTMKKSWRRLDKAAQRAPAGFTRTNPFHFNGRDYVGGQFIPGKAVESASPADREKLAQAKESEDRSAEAKKQARGSRAVDMEGLKRSLAPAHGLELTAPERGNAARAYAALKRHHGGLTLHRVAELAGKARQALDAVGDDHPNAEGLRDYWSRQLAAIASWVGRAEGEGMTGEAAAKAEPIAGDAGQPVGESPPVAGDAGAARREADRLIRDARPVSPVTQQRATAGGEVGPNGEWYPAGAFIATTDMPKRLREKLNRAAASRGEEVAPGERGEAEPGTMPIFQLLQPGWYLDPWKMEFTREAQPFRELGAAGQGRLEELLGRFKSGERFVPIAEYPEFARIADVARAAVAGEAVPGEALGRMPDWLREALAKYRPAGDSPGGPGPHGGPLLAPAAGAGGQLAQGGPVQQGAKQGPTPAPLAGAPGSEAGASGYEALDGPTAIPERAPAVHTGFGGAGHDSPPGAGGRAATVPRPPGPHFTGTLTDSAGRTYQFVDGKRVAAGGEDAPVEETPPVAGQEVATHPASAPEPAAPAGPLTIAAHTEAVKALRTGQLDARQIRENFERLAGSEKEIRAELAQRTIKELAPRGAGGLSKGKLIDIIWGQMLDRYIVGATLSWSPFSESKADAVRRQLASLTDEQLDQMRADAVERAASREKALSNPETLDEFSRFVATKGEAALTPEQQARWDDLVAERRRALKQEAEARQAVVGQVQGPEGLDMDIKEGFHAKRGVPVYVAVVNQRVDRDKYKELEAAARRLGGYYSAFRGQGAIPGFQFPTREAAEKFRSALSGDVDVSGDLQSRREAQAAAAAGRLAERADDIGAGAGEQLGRDRLANTARRAAHAAAAEESARKEQAFAGTLRNISEAIGSGQGKHLTGVRNAAQVRELERILQRAHYDDVRARMKDAHWGEVENAIAGQPATTAASMAKYPWPYVHRDVLKDAARKMQGMPGHKQVAARLLKQIAGMPEGQHAVTFDSPDRVEEFKSVIAALKKAGDRYTARNMEESLAQFGRVRAMGIESLPELRAALRQYAALRSSAQKADPIKEKERALIGKPIPGFFPTPRPVIDRMLEAADIRPGMSVLEPSAGKGDIADAVREASPEAAVSAVEPVGDLREILEAKGHQVVDSDFLGHAGQYDRIVMNPPFENGQDADHVRHAYDQLKPGGKLVAVMSEGPFFRQDRKAAGFRDWLSSVGGESEQMQGAFAGRDAFRQTGVKSRLVVIAKPAP